MGAVFEYSDTVRYSKVDGELKLSIPAIIDYFQDAAIEQSEVLGVGTKVLNARSLAWFLISWDVKIRRRPELGERIVVGTYPYRFRGMLGNRAVYMKTPEGEVLAEADALWTLMDTEHMCMTKIPEDILSRYELGDGPLFEGKGRKIEPFGEGAETVSCDPVPVQEYMLDNNGHVNNGQFVHLAMSYAPKGLEWRELRVIYRKQARPGDRITPVVSRDEKRVKISLDTDEPACEAELIRAE